MFRTEEQVSHAIDEGSYAVLIFSSKVEKSQKEARLDSLRGIFERIKNQELLVELSDNLKG